MSTRTRNSALGLLFSFKVLEDDTRLPSGSLTPAQCEHVSGELGRHIPSEVSSLSGSSGTEKSDPSAWRAAGDGEDLLLDDLFAFFFGGPPLPPSESGESSLLLDMGGNGPSF